MSILLSLAKMKNLVREKSKEFHVPPQQLYSLYGLEELLKRLSDSPYKEYLVIKGGYLLTSVFGLDNRTTKDLDASVKDLSLDRETIEAIGAYLESPYPDGKVHFKVTTIKDSRENFEYSGFNMRLHFINESAVIPLDLDITTGEKILPTPETKIPLIFSEGEISFQAYPAEQILSDKLYTTLAYGAIDDTNSRAKDLYDLYYLSTFHEQIDYAAVKQSIEATKKQRGDQIEPSDYMQILDQLESSPRQQAYWEKYQLDHAYAIGVPFAKGFEAARSVIKQAYPELEKGAKRSNELESGPSHSVHRRIEPERGRSR